MCLDVNQCGTVQNYCTQTGNLACTDPPINPNRISKKQVSLTTLWVIIACQKKWVWIGILKQLSLMANGMLVYANYVGVRLRDTNCDKPFRAAAAAVFAAAWPVTGACAHSITVVVISMFMSVRLQFPRSSFFLFLSISLLALLLQTCFSLRIFTTQLLLHVTITAIKLKQEAQLLQR